MLDHRCAQQGTGPTAIAHSLRVMRPARDATPLTSPPALWSIIALPGRTPATPTPAKADAHIGRARAVHDAALRLVAQRNDELRSIVGLAVQRLVRNDERGPRQ